MILLGEWQRHVRGQVEKVIAAIFSPDQFAVDIKFVRHSPGRRRNDTTMYDVCTASAAMSEAIRNKFSQFLRRDNPVVRPPELAHITIHPLVSIALRFSNHGLVH